jgi:hypothetical protein
MALPTKRSGNKTAENCLAYLSKRPTWLRFLCGSVAELCNQRDRPEQTEHSHTEEPWAVPAIDDIRRALLSPCPPSPHYLSNTPRLSSPGNSGADVAPELRLPCSLARNSRTLPQIWSTTSFVKVFMIPSKHLERPPQGSRSRGVSPRQPQQGELTCYSIGQLARKFAPLLRTLQSSRLMITTRRH